MILTNAWGAVTVAVFIIIFAAMVSPALARPCIRKSFYKKKSLCGQILLLLDGFGLVFFDAMPITHFSVKLCMM